MYMGFAPAVAAPVAAASGPFAPVVMGLSLVPSLITTLGRLFGAAPRGELQKFQRTLYPYMRTMAAKSGLSVYCYWFGGVVEVKPDGAYAEIASNLALSQARDYISRLPAPFYMTECPRPDGDCVNNPGDAVFQLYNLYGEPGEVVGGISPVTSAGAPTSAGPILPSGGVMAASVFPTGGISPILIVGAIVAVVLLAGRGKK